MVHSGALVGKDAGHASNVFLPAGLMANLMKTRA
jgi:hypothetical protein